MAQSASDDESVSLFCMFLPVSKERVLYNLENNMFFLRIGLQANSKKGRAYGFAIARRHHHNLAKIARHDCQSMIKRELYHRFVMP